MFSIFMCFFGVNIIYWMILDCWYIGIFYVFFVFIIFGIGVDDVFVFIDMWKVLELKIFCDLVLRIFFVYWWVICVMFIILFIIIVVFVISVFFFLLGVFIFGIFLVFLVFVNFCFVVIFFFMVIIIYEFYWKNYCWYCFGDLKVW